MMGLKEEIKRRQSVAVGALLTPGSGAQQAMVSPGPRYSGAGGDQHQVRPEMSCPPSSCLDQHSVD